MRNGRKTRYKILSIITSKKNTIIALLSISLLGLIICIGVFYGNFNFHNDASIVTNFVNTSTAIENYDTNSIENGATFMAFIGTISEEAEVKSCAGTFIGEKYVLTAAHCINKALQAGLILGTRSISYPKISFNSTTFIVHEHYNESTLDNDIGIIILDDYIDKNGDVNTICLSSCFNTVSVTSENLLGSVWGWANASGQLDEELLLKTVTIVDESKEAFADIKRESNKTESKIWAFGEHGPCHGDSGAPLLYKDMQIGIVSQGDANCNSTIATTYTRISHYIRWIIEKTDLDYNTLTCQTT